MATDQLSDKEIFNFARRLDSREAVEEYLDQICGDDGERRGRILKLVEADKGDSFLEKPPVALPETVESRSSIEREGQVIGNYKLLQKIGEGGMGSVWMANQEKPVRRIVALKIIKAGMDSKQVIARFEAERQSLALMSHPNIAKVLDAGTTDNGRPFFVMELIKGVPITEFCDKNKYSPQQRLNLFVDICRAVQHAHQKGVIHRDIKPSNVMVTLHDGVPVIKVIDFGLAKATSQKLTERTLFTLYGQMVGTPAYMSPEQAELSGLDIDTRSDVYSLGVLLYELMTGTTPIDATSLRKAGYAELQRIIQQEEAPPMSTRLSSLGGTSAVVAARRGSDLRHLTQLFRGDLDVIVLKSLEKDRSRRYSTPNDFADDVQRFLRNEAIEARPASTLYRLRKLYQRNKASVFTAVFLACVMLVASIYSTFQVIRANLAEGELQQQRYADLVNLGFNALGAGDIVRLKDVIQQVDALALQSSDPFELKLLRHLHHSSQPLGKSKFDSSVTSIDVCRLNSRECVLLGSTSGEILLRVDGKIHPLDPPNENLRMSDHLRSRSSVLISKDRRYAVAACSSSSREKEISDCVRVWDLMSQDLVSEVLHDSAIMTIALTSDGSSGISVDVDGTLKGWEVATGNVTWEHSDVCPYGNSGLAFVGDESQLALMGRDGNLHLISFANGQILETSKVGLGAQAIAVSPDGATLAVADDLEVRLWDFSENKLTRTDKFLPTRAWDVAISDDGTSLAMTGPDATVTVLDIPSWTVINRFFLGNAGTTVRFREGSASLLVGSLDSQLYEWSLDSASRESIRGVSHFILPLDVSGKNEVVTGTQPENTVVVWEPRRGLERTELYRHTARIGAASISTDGRIVASGDADGEVIVFDRMRHEEIVRWEHKGIVSDVDISHDGAFVATAGRDGKVIVYNLLEREVVREFRHDGFATAVCFSPSGKLLATGGGIYWSFGETKIWDLMSQTPSDPIVKRHPNVVVRVVFSPDEKLLAATDDYVAGKVVVWNVDQIVSENYRHMLKGHNMQISAIDFLSGENRMATASADGTIKFWDTERGIQVGSYDISPEQVRRIRFTPDGDAVISASNNGLVRIHRANP